VENVETRVFLQEATNHLIRLTNSHVDAVACDLHPKFTTTNLARELAEANGWQLVQVQHHHAHVAALMMEHAVDEIVGITCDGYGYGVDGEAWGGEILLCTRESAGFKRLAYLEKQLLLGGDAATRYPLRIAAGMLSKKVNVEPWLMQNSGHLPHGETEAKLMLNQLQKRVGITDTTSCGRVLDAVAAVLGVCYERTYEGEPAMKLESAAVKGKDALSMKPIINGNVLDTTQMLHAIFGNIGKVSTADLAYSAHAYVAKGLSSLAVEKALEHGVKNVGFSGGAACNQILAEIMRRNVEAAGLKFLVHEAIPAGDGGVSFGQAVVGGFFEF
jgi:hydrogenase maturation protein HypF